MEQSIRLLLLNIRNTLKDLDHVNYLIRVSQEKNNSNSLQSNTIRLKYLNRKVNKLLKDLRDRMHTQLSQVKFKVIYEDKIETYEMILSNVTKDDIHQILEVHSLIIGNNIEILEIKDIPTNLRKLQL